MEVEAHTTLTAPEVQARLDALVQRCAPTTPRRTLVYQNIGGRPRLYLSGWRFSPWVTAEVAVDGYHRGAAIVLRPMWGPLPAQWLRVFCVAGLVLAAIVLVYLGRGPWHCLFAASAAVLPIGACIWQRLGERRLQARLAELLDGAGFAATIG